MFLFKKYSIVLSIVTFVFGCIIIFFLASGFNDNYEITTDTNEYNNVIVGQKWELSEEIFPNEINDLDVKEFKHVYYDSWDANYLAYLVVQYDNDDYQKEISRLEGYGIDDYLGYYSVTGFSKYQLVAMEADSYNGFVYALTDGNNQIIYVEIIFCNYYMDIDYKKQIPNEYLPDGFDASFENPYQYEKH